MTPLFLVAFLALHVNAWGNSGHELTGAIAQQLLTADTLQTVQDLLQDQDGSLAQAATWADRAKFTKGYGFTRTLHYVDSKDHPPTKCDFDQERDCPGGKCITGAIANYTSRLSCRYSKRDRSDALKFLMHFLGDLTQPLHTCERARGGNDVKVKFDGQTTYKKAPKKPKGDNDAAIDAASSGSGTSASKNLLNLHGVWDYNILDKRISQAHGGKQSAMQKHLVTMAQQAMQTNEADDWTACLRAAKSTPLACAIAWTKDSNAINCDTVWKLYDENPSQDLGGKYYDVAWPIVEQQIVKAGVRAAAWFEANVKRCN